MGSCCSDENKEKGGVTFENDKKEVQVSINTKGYSNHDDKKKKQEIKPMKSGYMTENYKLTSNNEVEDL